VDGEELTMSTDAVEHHRKAAAHFTAAALHHTEAATITAPGSRTRRA
jgi:hypothetical protein